MGLFDSFFGKTPKNNTSESIKNRNYEASDWEGFGCLPRLVFEELTIQKMPSLFKEKLDTTGNEWKENSDDLKNLLPKLFTKYANTL